MIKKLLNCNQCFVSGCWVGSSLVREFTGSESFLVGERRKTFRVFPLNFQVTHQQKRAAMKTESESESLDNSSRSNQSQLINWEWNFKLISSPPSTIVCIHKFTLFFSHNKLKHELTPSSRSTATDNTQRAHLIFFAHLLADPNFHVTFRLLFPSNKQCFSARWRWSAEVEDI